MLSKSKHLVAMVIIMSPARSSLKEEVLMMIHILTPELFQFVVLPTGIQTDLNGLSPVVRNKMHSGG